MTFPQCNCPSDLPGNNWSVLVHLPSHFFYPQAYSGAIHKPLPSPDPFPPSSVKSLSSAARTPAQKWQPSLATLPRSQRLWVWPGRCTGPRKGAAGTGSDTVPTEPGLNSCPASPGGHPGLFCRCPGTCQACLCLVLLQPGLRPLSQCGAALGALARSQAWREACSVLWDAHTS